MKAPVAVNQRLADRLRGEGRISFEEFHQAVGYATRQGCRVEDALIELDIKLYGSMFVSSEKLY